MVLFPDKIEDFEHNSDFSPVNIVVLMVGMRALIGVFANIVSRPRSKGSTGSNHGNGCIVVNNKH